MSTINLTIDGQSVEAQAGETILEAARRIGVEIPTLCHHDELKPYGSCFICVVQVDDRPNLIPSCATAVREGMKVITENEDIAGARKMCLELLFSDHVGDCLGPCHTTCPCNIDIPGFINHIGEGRPMEAAKLIKQQLAQPASLGRVCPRPCEDACRRNLVDEPIAICSLKRHAADIDQDSVADYLPEIAPSSGKKITVVGAGPAGVAVAFYAAQWGHEVEVIDMQEAPGGMMRYGIPSYRLPRNVIDREISVLERMGVKFRYKTCMGRDITLDELRQQSDAVFLGLGAQEASSMRVKGEDLPGVLSGIGFLGQVSRDESTTIGETVMVVGGGNTAIDAARTALRCGAKKVFILYRRTRKEMPAYQPEIDAAEHEGVDIQLLAAPIEVRQEGDKLAVECIKMQLGEPDASGRRRPVPIEGSEHTIVVDNVVAAIGQRISDLGLVNTGLELTRWGSIVASERTLQTSTLPDVFTGGDCFTGADIAVRAAGAGHLAAYSIDQFVRGMEVVGAPRFYNHFMGALDEVPQEVKEGFDVKAKAKMPEIPVDRAIVSFDEVETGFPQALAQAEAERCMECGCRAVNVCKIREYGTRYEAEQDRFEGATREYHLDDSHPHVRYESHKCINCAACIRVSEELLGQPVLGLKGRGFTTRMTPAMGRSLGEALPHEGWEKVVEVCPTGALSRKDAKIATWPK